ncbi:SLC13 family permease [Oceanirhabdus sp. W0125-5]|uniref:SLC13 family permease n=1 Tax=Oceanirhabdus sp. W0125-5 TaxID=2999116 RepID=UPI0022F2EEF4|nr:SLC13 family permease [Oceanirhabdus sp. W0125-5]WBW96270.1 SLC13 family permease [Oceanirhabdus sp. W0125-5]
MQNLIVSKKISMNSIILFLKKEIVLTITTVLAIVSSFISIPKLEYINFTVLILLFNLMVVVSAFKQLNVLDYIATFLLSKCKSNRVIFVVLIFITFTSSMFITNDVALITFVPLALIIGEKTNINTMSLVIFETLAANLGSSFTPMGNPQNLYIYSFYNIKPINFFMIMLPVIILSITFLGAIIIKADNKPVTLHLSQISIKSRMQVLLFSILFIIILLSVFHIIDYRFSFILTLLVVLVLNKRLLLQVDYSLLCTFIAFFILVGNISSMDIVKNFLSSVLNNAKNTYFFSILTSQFISNVPAAVLISPFTNNYKELLLGCNIGGMGTLIASMASLISYKLYSKEYPSQNRKYLKLFTFYNIIGLIFFIPLIYIINFTDFLQFLVSLF